MPGTSECYLNALDTRIPGWRVKEMPVACVPQSLICATAFLDANEFAVLTARRQIKDLERP